MRLDRDAAAVVLDGKAALDRVEERARVRRVVADLLVLYAAPSSNVQTRVISSTSTRAMPGSHLSTLARSPSTLHVVSGSASMSTVSCKLGIGILLVAGTLYKSNLSQVKA